MARADLLLKRRGLTGIGVKGAYNVHPVKRGELIEVHQMVMDVKGRIHQVADDVGVFRNLDADCVFHRTYGGQRVNTGTDAADTFHKRPGVTRIAALQNHFQTAPHRARALGVDNDVVFIEHCLHAQVAFNARQRINNDAAGVLRLCHLASPKSLLFFLLRAWLTALIAICAAAATPTTATVASPTLSTVDSTPHIGGRISGSCL